METTMQTDAHAFIIDDKMSFLTKINDSRIILRSQLGANSFLLGLTLFNRVLMRKTADRKSLVFSPM